MKSLGRQQHLSSNFLAASSSIDQASIIQKFIKINIFVDRLPQIQPERAQNIRVLDSTRAVRAFWEL
jgi:hypothetical protein